MGSDKNEKTVYYLGNETTWDARVLFRCHRYQSTDSSLPIYFHHETYHINFLFKLPYFNKDARSHYEGANRLGYFAMTTLKPALLEATTVSATPADRFNCIPLSEKE